MLCFSGDFLFLVFLKGPFLGLCFVIFLGGFWKANPSYGMLWVKKKKNYRDPPSGAFLKEALHQNEPESAPVVGGCWQKPLVNPPKKQGKIFQNHPKIPQTPQTTFFFPPSTNAFFFQSKPSLAALGLFGLVFAEDFIFWTFLRYLLGNMFLLFLGFISKSK